MERDNKVLLGAVLILLVAMLSFNFNSITGNATNNKGKVTITVVDSETRSSEIYFNSDDLNIGQKILKITVNTEKDIDTNLELYRENGDKVGGFKRTICSTSYCKKGIYTIDFKFPSILNEGNYFFRVDSKRGLLVKDQNDESKIGSSYVKENFKSNIIRVTHFTPSYRGD